MKIIYTSDLHGDIDLYQELFQLIENTHTDCLILGGDFFKPSRDVLSQFKFIDHYLKDYFNRISIPIYLICGNTDFPTAMEYLRTQTQIQFLDLAPKEISGGFKLIGYSMINSSPFTIKDFERRDLKNESYIHWKPFLLSNDKNELIEMKSDFLNQLLSIEEELDLIEESDDMTIWVMHAPPYGGKLDVTSQNVHVGSKAIRSKIEEYQPKLTLHGHIHESPHITGNWCEQIGVTKSINPGTGDRLHAVIITIDEDKVFHFNHTVFKDI
jgi:Icc-related predicted phosphoesterase